MRSRYGEKIPRIGSVIVLTGSALYAQATTCESYVKKTWSKTGMVLVEALDALVKIENASQIGVVRKGLYIVRGAALYTG